ncbi:hypothetical protein [Rhizobium ruizarguesonis]|uniref:hypothetical protein n=1 Tax=Rhizobium ruizarguesonis TaxID=2081791 RepID=UPI0013C160DE|nr:hypothetical protein [Rhizobium ruizarguesonis]NEJ02615.1 hypothetical protein [Rhizobium ruizarguesonis]NEJ39742.1 hypothetical protein [Rhizobium ruizarguesonis]
MIVVVGRRQSVAEAEINDRRSSDTVYSSAEGTICCFVEILLYRLHSELPSRYKGFAASLGDDAEHNHWYILQTERKSRPDRPDRH